MNEIMVGKIASAIRALARVDDGAVTEDYRGFNKPHSSRGNALAATKNELWTGADLSWAHDVLRVYRNQLLGFGINYDELPVPVITKSNREAIRMSPSIVVLKFPYDDSLRKSLKSTFRNPTFNGQTKYWSVEVFKHQDFIVLAKFAGINGFELSESLQQEVDFAESIGADNFQPLFHQSDPLETSIPEPIDRKMELSKAKSSNNWTEVFFDKNDTAVMMAVKGLPMSHFCIEGQESYMGKRNDHFVKGSKRVFWLVAITSSDALSIMDFAKQFGFLVSDALREHINNISEAQLQNLEAQTLLDADIDIVGIAAGLSLYPFQRVGVKFAVENKRVIIGDHMGLGKTPQGMMAIQHSGAFPALIIVPALVVHNWANEIKKWLPGRTVQILTRKTVSIYADFCIISQSLVVNMEDRLSACKWKGVVVDEAHGFKNIKAKRTKAVVKLCKSVDLEMRVLLTGTPIGNRPEELLSLLMILDRISEFGGYRKFTQTYCNKYRPASTEQLIQLNKKLVGTCMIRRRREDVIKDLPVLRRILIPAVLSNRDLYDEAEEDIIRFIETYAASLSPEFMASIAELSDIDKQDAIDQHNTDAAIKASRAEIISRITALRAICGRGKIESAKAYIRDFQESDETAKLVVFGWHKDVVGGIASEFNALKIDGSTPAPKRTEIVAKFQNDPEEKLIVLNILAGGVGITLTAAETMLMVELPWTPGALEQAEARTYARINDMHGSLSVFVVADNTIDEWLWTLIEQKRLVIASAVDGIEDIDDILSDDMASDIIKKLHRSLREKMKKPVNALREENV